MSSELNSWIFSNSHQTEFRLPTVAIAQKDIAIVGLARVGVSMTRCSTTGEITWRVIKGICSPGENEATYQELEHPLSELDRYGQYVDKLSQFFVIGCHFGIQSNDSPLLLNYLDDTQGPVPDDVMSADKRIKVAGNAYDTILLESEPMKPPQVASISGSIIGWLSELGYFPVQVKTKLGRLPLTVRLTGFSDAKTRPKVRCFTH